MVYCTISPSQIQNIGNKKIPGFSHHILKYCNIFAKLSSKKMLSWSLCHKDKKKVSTSRAPQKNHRWDTAQKNTSPPTPPILIQLFSTFFSIIQKAPASQQPTEAAQLLHSDISMCCQWSLKVFQCCTGRTSDELCVSIRIRGVSFPTASPVVSCRLLARAPPVEQDPTALQANCKQVAEECTRTHAYISVDQTVAE